MEFQIIKNNPNGGVSDHVPRSGNPDHAAVRRQFGIQVFVPTILAHFGNISSGLVDNSKKRFI
ncbi:MAG: hypothetical protein COX29_03055 [Candidatus Moranbacteria bacterium CG23_combo_of_CG06-09_8_20_14_all_35_22]|nr:MAG: hypothetical protein COX29_03055 [Candidatus Moranbacteria bacterium CG23_combo_of_CG06-09_8_20_14_all_35_22]